VSQSATLPRKGSHKWHAVVAALLELSDNKAELVRHIERPWSTATFSGTRHQVELRFEGMDAAIIGEAMIEGLQENEFAIRGQLVADCSIVSIERRGIRAQGFVELIFVVELLLLEEK